MSSKSNSWKQHFDSRPTGDAGNQNMEAFLSALEASVLTKAKLAAITGNQDVIILASDVDNNVRLAHSLKNLGGNVLWPTDKVVALFGLGPKASVFELYANALAANVKVASATADQLKHPDKKHPRTSKPLCA